MRNIKKVWSLLTYHWKELFLFELIYKVICYGVAVPLVRLSISGIIWVTGFRYITKANLWAFLLHPVTILLALVLLFLMTWFSMIDISTVIYILDRAYQKKGVSILAAVRFSIANTKKIFHPRYLALVGYVLFMVPFIHLGLSTGMINSIVRPEYIAERVNDHWYFMLLLYGGMAVIVFFLLRWLFLFHSFTLEGTNFHDSKVVSIRLVKGYRLKFLLVLVILELVLSFLYWLVSLGGVAIITLIGNIPSAHPVAGSILYSVILVFLSVIMILFLAMAFPFIYSVISVLYYSRKESLGEEIKHPEAKEIPKKPARRFRALVLVAFFVAVGVGSVFLYGVTRGKYDLLIENVHSVQVTAHRGISEGYPENTIASFRGAYEDGADWIELDVQQLKDGNLIICHDKNVKRVTGVNRNVWDMTLEEAKSLDVDGEPMPTLDEAIEFAIETGIRLNIEIKPTGHETNLEEEVVASIEKYLFQPNCVVSSFNHNSLKKVKELDPMITTGYITDVAAGQMEEIEQVDIIAIEPTFVTESMVSAIHNEGMQVWVWTVNNEDNIIRMIDHDVDNIITDRVPLVKELANESRTGNAVAEVVEGVGKLLK